jgi:hypothetical protein
MRSLASFGAVLAIALGLALGVVTLAACGPRFDWRETRSPDGYIVALPGRAQSVTRDLELPGGKVTLTMRSIGIDSSLFAVGSARLPPAAVADAAATEQTLAYFRDALVRNVGAIEASRSAAKLPGRPERGAKVIGEEIAAHGRAGRKGVSTQLAARLFIVDDRFFEVVAIFADGEVPPAELETFFTSFRLLP